MSLHSQIATTISIDGKQVSATEAACAGESCIERPEWTLESPSYSMGKDDYELRIEQEELEREEQERREAEAQLAEEGLEGPGDEPSGDEVWDTSAYRPIRQKV